MQMYKTFEIVTTKSFHVLWPQAREAECLNGLQLERVDFFVYIARLFSEIQLRQKRFQEPHTNCKYAKTDV